LHRVTYIFWQMESLGFFSFTCNRYWLYSSSSDDSLCRTAFSSALVLYWGRESGLILDPMMPCVEANMSDVLRVVHWTGNWMPNRMMLLLRSEGSCVRSANLTQCHIFLLWWLFPVIPLAIKYQRHSVWVVTSPVLLKCERRRSEIFSLKRRSTSLRCSDGLPVWPNGYLIWLWIHRCASL